MELTEIQQRNYDATVRRGLITPQTSKNEFIDKIREETNELDFEANFFNGSDNEKFELSDIIIVCLCYAKHHNIDIKLALEEKTIINEKRND